MELAKLLADLADVVNELAGENGNFRNRQLKQKLTSIAAQARAMVDANPSMGAPPISPDRPPGEWDALVGAKAPVIPIGEGHIVK